MKDEFIRDKRRIDFLKRLIKVVININDKLYEYIIKKRFDNPRSRVGTYTGRLEYRGGGSTRT